MTFSEIVERVIDRLGIPSSATASVARISRSVNDIYREVTTTIGLNLSRRGVSVPGATSLGLATITFTGIEKIERILDDTSGSTRVLDEKTFDQIREIHPAASDHATMWAVESWTANSVTIRLNILAQTIFNLKADGFTTAATLTYNDTPDFPESFHDILVNGVLVDEYLKLEKPALSDRSKIKYEERLSQLRMWRAKSISKIIRQGETKPSALTGGSVATGGGSAPSGGTSYTQSGLITFDRDPAAPFAVTVGSAKVDNLDADLLDGLSSTDVIAAAVAAAGDVDGPFSSTDNAIARFDGITGKVLQNSGITIADGTSGTLSNTNSGDVTLAGAPTYITIAAQAITRTLINLASHVTGKLPFANIVSLAASNLFGRGSAGGTGDVEPITLGAGLSMSATTLSNTQAANQAANVVLAGPPSGGAAAPTFRALVAADIPATTSASAGVFNSTTQTLTDAVEAALTFDTEDYDTSNFHDNSTNPTRLTVPSTGVYLISATCSFAALATGFRYLRLQKNGTTAISGRVTITGVGGSTLDLHISALVNLTVGEYVEVMATVTSNNVSTGNAATRHLQNSAQIAKIL